MTFTSPSGLLRAAEAARVTVRCNPRGSPAVDAAAPAAAPSGAARRKSGGPPGGPGTAPSRPGARGRVECMCLCTKFSRCFEVHRRLCTC